MNEATATEPPSDEPGSRSVAWLRGALALGAAAVLVQASLGFAGALRVAPAVWAAAVLVALVSSGVAMRRRSRRAVEATAERHEPWTPAAVAVVAATMAALGERLWAGLSRSTFLYDVLSYHLHVPAAWRAAGKLFIVPTPFGDPAPAYAPSNAELTYHLLLNAAGNATLAHAGQVPFAVLATLAIYATGRTIGAAREAACASALAFLLIPEVWQQAPTAMADVAMASLFLAALPFLLRLEQRRSPSSPWPDVIGLGLAYGLLLGTKYAAVVIGAPLLAWTAWLLARRPRLTTAPGRVPAAALWAALVLACGGFWYVRNLLVAGNPVFPATVTLGPFTLARGLYDGAVIRTSEYHLPVSDVAGLADIFGEIGWGPLIGFALGTISAIAARRWRWPALALLLVLLCWFVVPYQQSRFFFPVWGVAAVALAATGARAPKLGATAIAIAIVGGILQYPTPARLGLLVIALVTAGVTLIATRAAPIAAGMARMATMRHRLTAPARFVAATVVCVAAMGGVVAWARAPRERPAYAIGDYHDDAWSWIQGHVRDARIAYTGSNLPFPLWGASLQNRVRYVNVAGNLDAVAHDFVHLAIPLPLPLAPQPEPAPERLRPDRAIWLANLETAGIDVLFVAALYPGVRRANAHDQQGFPVERAWADALPRRFSLVFANDGIRIYRHHHQASVQ